MSFSVLHIQPDHDEVVYEAEYVRHSYTRPDGAIAECVALHYGGGEVQWLWEGRVFVMNHAGKTVATFYLSELAEGGPPRSTRAITPMPASATARTGIQI